MVLNHSKISTKSTSRQSAISSDIIIRSGSTTRLLFRPIIVANQENPEASVKGTFIWQRKSPKDSWLDIDASPLTKLKAGEGYELALKSAELKSFVEELAKLYSIHQAHGIPLGDQTFSVVPHKMESFVQSLMDNPPALTQLIKQESERFLPVFFACIAEADSLEQIVLALQSLKRANLEHLETAARIAQLEQLLETWKTNSENDDESWWQSQFKEFSWVLPQIIPQPLVLLQEQAYLGGKSISGRGGKVIDFIYKNKLTGNVALIEIKTPKTPLLASKYREGVYSLSKELNGGIAQAIAERDRLEKDFFSLSYNSCDHFDVFNPKCILVAGNLKDQVAGDRDRIRSFELQRCEHRTVNIVTFDEVFARLELLLEVLMDKPPEVNTNDVPF